FLEAEYPYVSTDAAFHAFVLVARGALGELDSLVVAPRLRRFCAGMFAATLDQWHGAGGPLEREAALRDAEIFAVATALPEQSLAAPRGLPENAARSVEDELRRIRGH